MLQHEFEARVGMEVSPNEYLAINAVYESSDVEKDEFCRLWAKMNHQRVARAKAEAKAHKQFKAMPLEKQLLAKMQELAQARANETGSMLPVTDLEVDTDMLDEYSDSDSFKVYFVLRDTGSAIKHALFSAKAEADDFKSSNPVIYEFYANRCLNFGQYRQLAYGNAIDLNNIMF